MWIFLIISKVKKNWKKVTFWCISKHYLRQPTTKMKENSGNSRSLVINCQKKKILIECRFFSKKKEINDKKKCWNSVCLNFANTEEIFFRLSRMFKKTKNENCRIERASHCHRLNDDNILFEEEKKLKN